MKRISCAEDARSKRIVVTGEVIESWALENVVYQDLAQKMRTKLSCNEVELLEQLLEKSLG
ncbi:hypothetical protein JCM19233_1665 [Vibrio astriarenae]|nr:hypothetical protein JCM19233_1665 [Vibrio sp. C7]